MVRDCNTTTKIILFSSPPRETETGGDVYCINIDHGDGAKVLWKKIRLIWIAFYKNRLNGTCFIHRLPKDIVSYILTLIFAETMKKKKPSRGVTWYQLPEL